VGPFAEIVCLKWTVEIFDGTLFELVDAEM